MPYVGGRRLSGAVLGALGALDPDALAQVDPSSAFAGWTNRQIDEYWAHQGVAVLTPELRASATVDPTTNVATHSADDVAASQASLVAGAEADQKVSAALEQLKTGAFGSDVAARSAANEAANEAQLVKDAHAAADSMRAAGGVFADEVPAGTTYDANFTAGLQTRQEWIDSFIKNAHAGAPAGFSPEEAVAAGVLSQSEADYINAKASGADVSSSPHAGTSSIPAAAPIYFQGGQYVDEHGGAIPPETLDALGYRVTTTPAPDGSPSGDLVPAGPSADQVVLASGSLEVSPWVIAGAAFAGLAILGNVAAKHSRPQPRRKR